MRVVISQSMLFPWVGMLEQFRLADVFVHYDDVAFSKGSFVNRVQIKTAAGSTWMTVPLRQIHLGQTIEDVAIKPAQEWRAKHLDLLERSFEGARHGRDAIELARTVYATEYTHLGALARASMLAIVDYFGLRDGRRIVDVRELGVPGRGSERVLATVKQVDGTEYITGHGAAQYLDHEQFERAGVKVSYMQYRREPYPQLHGDFTPYVSSLDLIANVGRAGARYISSGTIDWREFMRGRHG